MTEDQQDQLVISLDTQYAVAHAISLSLIHI